MGGNKSALIYIIREDKEMANKTSNIYAAATYTSYSGCDIVATITIPNFASQPLVIGELQTISYSIHREKSPVRTLGRANPVGFTYGTRTIAGSLIFTVFDKNLVYKIVRLIKEGLSTQKNLQDYGNNIMGPGVSVLTPSAIDTYIQRIETSRAFVMDEMPPFDVTISFMNEYGHSSKLVIKGIVIVDEGQVMSIEDMITENTMSYMASDIIVLNDESEGRTSVNTFIRASDTSLSSLTVSYGTLVPSFDPTIFNYTVQLPAGTTTVPSIHAMAADQMAQVDIVLADNISQKSRVRVTGNDGSTTDYYIKYKTVTSNANLSSIMVSGVAIDNFNPLVYNYNVDLYDLKGVPKVSAIPEDPGATVTVNRAFTLPGTTEIIVTADDGRTQKKYYVHFSVLPKSSNALLSYLVSSNGVIYPSFNSNIFTYKNIIPYNSTVPPAFNALPQETDAQVDVQQPTSISGSGAVCVITVTAPDGVSQKTYECTVVVDHQPFEEVFANIPVGEALHFTCKVIEPYDDEGGVIATDSYFGSTSNPSRLVYIRPVNIISSIPVADSVSILGTFTGYVSTPYGMIRSIDAVSAVARG